jgi:SAM-dependent methyltransferase
MIRFRRLLAFMLSEIGRTVAGVSTIFHYLAVGTLRLSEMRDGIRYAWQDYCSSDAEVTAGLMPWEREMVDRFVQPGATVLVVGSGSGRELNALAARGCHVTGVEPAAPALRTAQRILRQQGLSATLVEGFFEDVPLSGHFDVIIFSSYCYTYIPESRRRADALRKAAAHLTDVGHILVSYPVLDGARSVAFRLARVRLARMMAALCGSDWRLEPGDLVYAVGSGATYSYCHDPQSGEIEREAAAAGLRPVFRRDAPSYEPVVVLVRA